VRAFCLLYTAWSEGEISASLFSLAAADLFASASKKAHALTSFDGQTVEMQVEEQAIDVIEIRGNNNTKAAVIIRELEFSGIKPGMAYSADLDDLFNRANEASKRLKCFSIKAIYYEQDHGVNTLVVEVDEQSIMSAPVGASYGSQATSLLAGFNHNNLFGGGEKLAVELKFNWFHAEGFKHFNSYGGNFSYQEPYLFLIGSDHPVSGKINLEYGQRPNYDTNKFETVIGGSVGLGIRLARNTTLIVAPSLYSVGSHYELGLGTGIEYDNRDNIFLPNKGVYFSSMLTPGAAINSSQDNPYYIKLDNDLRGYVPLPLGMVLAMRGVFGIGYNLAGGNKYFMGGNFLNPYVRSAGSSMAAGSLVLAASLELRSPVINAEYAKLQPYIYCDAGSVFSSTLYSCGLGLRVLAPVIGLFNLGVGLPGGFFLWLGPMGWN
jgi:outer membrane protein assembly factor BamA